MKILYFSQFYTPESIAPAFRATDNSRIWVNEGNEVIVFTGYPNYPKGKIFDGYKAKLLTEENINGVRVLRSKLVAKPNVSIISRLENALSYFFFGIINIIFNNRKIGENYDVVLGTSGVIFNALLAWIYSSFHRLPFVLEIRDITYIQLMATGKSSKSFSVKAMRMLELFLCNKARKVVVVTNGFKKTLAEDGIAEKKIEVITNGVDILDNGMNSNCRKNKLILSYFGTLGISQNIIDTFSYAKSISTLCDSFEYLLIGEGAQKDLIRERLSSGEYPFVRMLHGMSADELEPYYGMTQLSVITLKKSDNFKHTIPSKLFQVMGRGIPVLFIGPKGETSDIIQQHHAGIVLTGTTKEDIETLEDFFSHKGWETELLRMGERGKMAVKNKYSRKQLAKVYLEMMNSLIKKS